MSPGTVALEAHFRSDSKLRAILLGDQAVARELIAVAVHRKGGDLLAWLKTHGVSLARSSLQRARQRLLAAVCKVQERADAVAAALRNPMTPEGIAALAAEFRQDSKLRAILAGDPKLACEMIAVASQGSWTGFAEWLKAHGVTMCNKTSSIARQRLLAAVEKIQRRNAILAGLRAEAKRCGTTLTGAALDRAVFAIADIIDAIAGDPKKNAPLLFNATSRLTGVRGVELRETESKARKTDRALKREEFKWRRETKICAGLKQIEKEMGRNAKVKDAIYAIRAAMEEAA